MPSLATCFWISFALTLLLVTLTVVQGYRRRRRSHLVLALVSVGLLTLTIVFAERLGATRNFPRAEMRVHLWFAKSATLSVLPVVFTGVGLWYRPRWRLVHRSAVFLFLLLTVAATATGTWAYGLSTEK